MGFQIKFGDQVLDDVAVWQDRGGLRVEPEVFPRRHEAIIPATGMLAPRRIVVSGEVVKADESALKTYLQGVLAKFVNLGRDKLYLYDDSRYLIATAKDWSIDREAARTPSRAARFQIAFDCQPFFYGSEQTHLTESLAAVPYNFVVTNNGGFRSPVTIEITPSFGSITGFIRLANTTVGLLHDWAGEILSDNVLQIDKGRLSDGWTIKNGGANGFPGWVKGSSFWELEPGANNLQFNGGLGPTTLAKIEIKWTERWILQ